jgi:hypothetical protein
MDPLRSAVLDISRLVATCRALKLRTLAFEPPDRQALHDTLRREVRRGARAYIDTLVRTRQGAVDEARLIACRLAAEQHMPLAIAHEELLCLLVAGEAASLDGLSASQRDLLRLAKLCLQLRVGKAIRLDPSAWADAKSATSLASSLRRRTGKALAAYARAMLKTKLTRGQMIAVARAAALAEIGPRGAAQAERLADAAAGGDAEQGATVRVAVNAVFDLGLDWQPPVSAVA